MHYHEQKDGREKTLTRDFVSVHQSELCRILDLHPGDRVVVELQKTRYDREGDVDIAVWKNPDTSTETFIAVEIKCLFLDSSGEFHSKKTDKHHRQIRQLEKEGWDYIWFFDFIVTTPADSWFHPQGFEGFDKYDKTVESIPCGHVAFQINSVLGKPESMAGSISNKVVKAAQRMERSAASKKIEKVFAELDFTGSPIVIDAP